MPNTYFQFKQFTIHQDRSAMKVCTDACLFGAWLASEIREGNPAHMLDIGAGTGLLSLMVAQQTSGLIDAVEADRNACEQAIENIGSSPFSDRITTHHCLIQSFDRGYGYDLIFSNPPFYNGDLTSPDVKRNIAMHGISLSMDQLIANIKRLLLPTGKAALIIPYRRMMEVEPKLVANGFYVAQRVLVRQSARHAPFRCMYMLTQYFTPLEERKITVKDVEFNSLLESYYL